MKANLAYILLLLVFASCRSQPSGEKLFDARSDIRLGSKFYSIYLKKDGTAYVVKGIGSDYTEALKIESSDTSSVFRLDSAKVFFKRLERIESHPIVEEKRLDAPRVEIYYKDKKIYDAYSWDETFWDMFSPIMSQIPKSFSPFRLDDAPF